MSKFTFGMIAVVVVGIAGCGMREVPNPMGTPAPVKGKVLISGKPVSRGTVAFFPIEPGKGMETFGTLSANGEYSTTVYPGKYRVAIEPDGVRSATPLKTTPVPNKYWKADISGLEIDVPDGGREGADFILP